MDKETPAALSRLDHTGRQNSSGGIVNERNESPSSSWRFTLIPPVRKRQGSHASKARKTVTTSGRLVPVSTMQEQRAGCLTRGLSATAKGILPRR